MLYTFQQDMDPSYAHDEAQLCSSKDVNFTAPASFGPFLAVAFLNGNLSQIFLDVPNARDIPVVLTRFGPTYVFLTQNMDKNVFSFSYTTSSTAGHRSLYLVTPGNTWSHLATFRHTWQHYICPLLVTPGNSWSQIAGYGSKMPKSHTFVKKWLLVTLCNIWSH